MDELLYVPRDEFTRIRGLAAGEPGRLELFATACRLNTLYMIARAGSGHVGTSFSSLDIMACLYLKVLRNVSGTLDSTEDVFFSSKGHDAPAKYAVLLGMGLLDFDLVHRLRRLGGLPGHPDVSVPHTYTNTGSLGMGVSKARGMALARRRLGKKGHVFVLTGDGELQEGQFWEALQPTANLRLDEITVIVDHNKLQSDTFVARVSDLGDLGRKITAFGWDVCRCDGHDMRQLLAVLPPPTEPTGQPRLIIADTVKGRGVSFMEHTAMGPDDRLYPYHSGAPAPSDYHRAVAELTDRANDQLRALRADALRLERVPWAGLKPLDGAQKLIGAYSEALVAEAERNPRLVVLDGDLAKDTGLLAFEEKYPDRFFECGIAEQDMVSQAGGMALAGLLPVVHSFAAFLSARPNEQIYNNASERTKILYVGSLAGLLPAGPGHTHQSVRDIAALGAIPDLIAIEPCAEEEVAAALDYCVNRAPSSCYLRLVSIPAELPYELPRGYRLEPGRGVALSQGTDGVLIGAGPVMLAQAYRAAALLAGRAGVRLQVVNLPWLNRVDTDWLADLVAGVRWVFTVDNHYLMGGQGQMIVARLAELDRRPSPRAKRLGLTDFPLGGGNTEVLRAHRLDGESLFTEIATAMDVRPR